jgi:hypothetical protein
MNTKIYANAIKKVLSPAERRIFSKLKTPQKIQDYLDTFKNNFEQGGDMLIYSPREVLKRRKAHCIEGALFAATALAYHGARPLLLDLRSTSYDLDHVVALFTQDGHWGAISKTNHPVLRYRDPIYRSVRELAISYFHEYFLGPKPYHGRKTMRDFSAPFNLQKYKPALWIVTTEDLDWLAVDLDGAQHFPLVTTRMVKKLRNASKIEIDATEALEWPEPKKKQN